MIYYAAGRGRGGLGRTSYPDPPYSVQESGHAGRTDVAIPKSRDGFFTKKASGVRKATCLSEGRVETQKLCSMKTGISPASDKASFSEEASWAFCVFYPVHE